MTNVKEFHCHMRLKKTESVLRSSMAQERM